MAKKQNKSDFQNFIDNIKDESDNYDYVCVRGKRCFNIISRLLPKIDFITFPALMLHYRELSDFYEKNKRFPKILLIDDLVFDDREMAHDLQQLEDLLAEELLDRKLLKKSDNYLYQVYQGLSNSITIHVLAKIDSRFICQDYLEKTNIEIERRIGELLNYSLNLEEKLKNWDIANTDYTYSVRSQELLDIILKQQNGRIDQTKWVRQEETCMGEPMILYTRLNGDTSTNRIDTIRIFPDRLSDYKELPLISSYTFFGALSEEESYQIINEVRKELEKLGLTKLAEILKMSNNDKINSILLEHKMKFISCILSVSMLYDFCNDMCSVEHLESGAMYGDFWKISRNFGKRTELTEEFKVIRKKEVRERLSSIILNIVDSNAKELIPYNADDVLNNGLNIESTNLDKIIDIMRNIMFRIEMQSKKLLKEETFNHFDAKNYQTNISDNETYGHDGIITFNKLFDLEEIKKSIKSYSDIYSLIFATIGLMDNHQANLNLKPITASKGNTIVQNCITTNEQATFYLPEKLAQLSPLIFVMERFTYGAPYARSANFRDLILACFGERAELILKSPFEFSNSIKKSLKEEIMNLTGEASLELALQKLFSNSERFYYGGFEFRDFDFNDLETISKKRLVPNTPKLKECLKVVINGEYGDDLIQQSSPKDEDSEKKYIKKRTSPKPNNNK